MTFAFPLLLAGMATAAIPVLLHLLMRQKAKQLPFPAFRFLLQRHRTNQRKLRLRHILLLTMRVLLLVLCCLALSRPKLLSERLNLSSDQPVFAVFLFDNSLSMEYTQGARSRLEDARVRAIEVLNGLPEGSKVAVLDTATTGGEWLPTPSLTRQRIEELAIRAGNSPTTSRIAEALRILTALDQEEQEADKNAPRFLYIFSDRTPASWDAARARELEQMRQRSSIPIRMAYVDVGVADAIDLAVTGLQVQRQPGVADDRVVLQVTVSARGQDCDTEVRCRLDAETSTDSRQLKLAAGQSQSYTFERRGLSSGQHQAEVYLASSDSMPFDNVNYLTFEVRPARRVLVLADDPRDAEIWRLALESSGAFRCEIRQTMERRAELTPTELSQYAAVCLLNVARPDATLWEVLERYLRDGGGVAIIPGGEELGLAAYNDDKVGQSLLPARFVKVVEADAEPGVPWRDSTYQHPILSSFRDWKAQGNIDFIKFPPAAMRYWEVTPIGKESSAIASYADKENRPALLERLFDRGSVKGRLILLTTPMDDRRFDQGRKRWNDYLPTFYLVLANKVVGYLAGDLEETPLTFACGQTVSIPLSASQRFATYTLVGPGVVGTDAILSRTENQSELTVTKATAPGNYQVLGPDGKRIAAFSLNPNPEEHVLDLLPEAQIEAVLGDGTILTVTHGTNLKEALQGHWGQPVELFPWLMLLVLFLLAIENLLANRFYKQPGTEAEEVSPISGPENESMEGTSPSVQS